MKPCSFSQEILSAYADGEAGESQRSCQQHLAECSDCRTTLESWRQGSAQLIRLVDQAIGDVDPLVALTGIRATIAQRQERRVYAKIVAFWNDSVMFHRRAVAGVALAMGLGALSTPFVILLAARHLHTTNASATFAGMTVEAAPYSALHVRVIWAHNRANEIDPSIAGLIKNLGGLGYIGYKLEDEATIKLEPASSDRMHLPNGAWLTFTVLDTIDDKLRLGIEAQELEFKTTVSITDDATLAVGGPSYDGGVLILVLTRQAR